MYLHARNEDGSIETPAPAAFEPAKDEEEKPETYESELAKLELLANFSITQGGKSAAAPFVSKEQFAELKEKLRRKYEANGG